MRAVITKRHGGPEVLALERVDDPQPEPDHVLISVKAFGINRAETYMRRGQWGDSAKIGGIECVGTVRACPNGQFKEGAKVAALMGGMGRTRNGSYAEFTNPPATNVVPIETDLPWEDFAAIPMSYACAWTCLVSILSLVKGQTILIRGATSAFGQAAINIAADLGAEVIAASRQQERLSHLRSLGAKYVELEDPGLSARVLQRSKVDAVLDLIGERTALDSLGMLRYGGRACLSGFLGGIESGGNPNFLDEMPAGVFLALFGSSVLGTPDGPMTKIPLQEMVDKAAAGVFKAKPARVFSLGEIARAHEVMEANEANGKIVVVVD